MIRPPFDPDPLTVTAMEQAAWDEGYERGIRDSFPPVIGLLLVSLVAAIVGLLVGWSMATASAAAPRSGLLPHPGGDAARIGAPQRAAGHDADVVASGAPFMPAADASPVAGSYTTIRGTATWYCSSSSACTHGFRPSSMVAAIDPTTGIRKGTWLTIRYGRRHIAVQVVDVCACAGNRVIDLTSGAFRKLAPLSAGRIAVSIEVVGDHAPLPATDAVP